MMTLTQADADPTIRPYWRWQAAVEEVENPSKRGKVAPEPQIAEVIAYLRGDPCPRRSTIDAARKIFETDGLRRAELESRILAGQTDGEIAARCDLPGEVVTTYEEMFFAVRRYLHAADWLLSRTNDRARWYGYQNHQLRQLWCWYAIAGGPIILDYLIDAYRALAGPKEAPRIDLYFSPKSSMQLSCQGSMALHLIPVDWVPGWYLTVADRHKAISLIRSPAIKGQEEDGFHRECVTLALRVLAGKPYQDPRPASGEGTQRQPHSIR